MPAFALFVGLIIFGGRTATTHEAVESAAADAARSASIARDAGRRRADAREAATASIANQEIGCSDVDVAVDTSRLQQAAGRARLGRRHRLLPPRPVRSRRARRPRHRASCEATMSSPIDTWRERMTPPRRARLDHRLAGPVQLRDDLPRRPRRRPRRTGPRPRASPRRRRPGRARRRRGGRGQLRHPGPRRSRSTPPPHAPPPSTTSTPPASPARSTITDGDTITVTVTRHLRPAVPRAHRHQPPRRHRHRDRTTRPHPRR